MALFSLGIFFFRLERRPGQNGLVADDSVGQLLFLRTVGAVVRCSGTAAMAAWLPASGVEDQPWLHGPCILCMVGRYYAFYFATKLLSPFNFVTFYPGGALS